MTEDVIQLLLGQHGQIRDLFTRVQEADGRDRRDAFAELVRLLAVHETAEEQVVHPLARRAIDAGAPLVDDRLAEERQAKELLSRLESMGADHEDFLPLLAELRASVLLHAHHEEQYEFPYLRHSCNEKELRGLAVMVRAAERVAPTHPHPGVETGVENLAAGPALALFDRVKDAVSKAISTDDRTAG
ncbi:hemerythrin [Lentzea sp. NBRC 105346]|uniref:hemerythrin domain-containing protein n=1 Tax=Lentzea sp. NBRC 105346 TaxID=3032205 RepID=UPI0024A064FD|nr:hemerythrin domain-containing protein [Lentzea sp. NBRC 105346]GLZ27879.1 hemerythrin [Lentzea sp. NBRC 105346]